jgi:hypothetical protein
MALSRVPAVPGHATRCASPNPRLQGALRAKGFTVAEVEGKGQVFRLVHRLEPPP